MAGRTSPYSVSRALPSRYAAAVGDPDPKVDELRRMLEAELDRRLKPQWGCWPLAVGVLGALLGLALLAEIF